MTMPSRDVEVAAGLKEFEEALLTANLRIVQSHRHTDRLATYFCLGSRKHSADLVASLPELAVSG
jgi:hypothetical protein